MFTKNSYLKINQFVKKVFIYWLVVFYVILNAFEQQYSRLVANFSYSIKLAYFKSFIFFFILEESTDTTDNAPII